MNQIKVQCSECGKDQPATFFYDADGNFIFYVKMKMCECKYKSIVERRKRDREREGKP